MGVVQLGDVFSILQHVETSLTPVQVQPSMESNAFLEDDFWGGLSFRLEYLEDLMYLPQFTLHHEFYDVMRRFW